MGPNGKGKSTLLKMIANGSLKIPPRIDALYVEQEVRADETPAFEAVLMADKIRWALIVEERQLITELAAAPNEAKDSRLAEVYEEVGGRWVGGYSVRASLYLKMFPFSTICAASSMI